MGVCVDLDGCVCVDLDGGVCGFGWVCVWIWMGVCVCVCVDLDGCVWCVCGFAEKKVTDQEEES